MSAGASAVSAIAATHRLEQAELMLELIRYRALLEEHGIEPPSTAGREGLASWRDVAGVIALAYELVHAVDELREKLGPAKELLDERWSGP